MINKEVLEEAKKRTDRRTLQKKRSMGMKFSQLTLEEMLCEAKNRPVDDELRVLAEAAERRVEDAWKDGYDHGYYDGDLNTSDRA